MVRTKQFDRHVVLDEAMEVFWERGYHATSISDLVERLGVNRQSLYDTYGGKDELFLAALERYREIQTVPVRRLLERDGPVLEILREFFDNAVNAVLGDGCKGCFMVNTATELAGHDPAVARSAPPTPGSSKACSPGCWFARSRPVRLPRTARRCSSPGSC